jgi:ubiquitin C-terminal hydrolase
MFSNKFSLFIFYSFPSEIGYEVLERSLIAPSLLSNQDSYAPLFRLAFQSVLFDELTGGLGGANSEWLDSIKAGTSLDALAADKTWRVAKVVSLRSISAENSSSTLSRIVRVSFKGWGSNFDEDLPQSLKRLARLGTHTAGKDTRRNARQGESFRVDMNILASLESKIDMLLDGSFPADERDTFARGELPEYVLEVMSSKYDDTETISAEDLRNRISHFNKKVLSLCVHHINAVDVPIPPEVLQHLQRYFLMDERCNFFYSYGHMYHFDADAVNYVDKAAGFPAVNKASKYWVASVNAFWKLGGMEAVLKRYTAHTISANHSSSANSYSHSGSGEASEVTTPSSTAWADPDASNELMIVIKAVCMGRWCFTRYWGETYFAKLRDCVMNRLQSLSVVQLKKINVAEIDGIRTAFFETAKVQIERYGNFDDQLTHRRILFGPQATPEDPIEPYHYEFDRLGLPFWVKLLAIDSLTLRVKAVTELNEIYRTVIISFDQKAAISNNPTRGAQKVKPLFSFDFLFNYTRDHRVINLLLGEIEPGHPNSQVHVQLLSRIGAKDGVLEACALAASIINRDKTKKHLEIGLTPRHIDLLWNIFLEARGDDTVRRAVLEILESLAPRLTSDYHIQIFKHFSLFPMSEFDVPMVRIVAGLTRHAVLTAESSTLLGTSPRPVASAGDGDTTLLFGLHLLWDMSCVDVDESTDESEKRGSVPSKAVVDAAQTLLLDLLQRLDPKRELVKNYVLRAAVALIRGEANIQHIRMLSLLLTRLESSSTVASAASHDMSADIVQDLVVKHNVCGALVRDVQTYKERAIKANKKRRLTSAPDTFAQSQSETIFYGRYSHNENLSERLRLLSFLSMKAQVGLSSEQISTLWTALIDTAMSESEHETFYSWLQSALRPDDQHSARFISSKDIQTIFVAHFISRKQPWDVKKLGVNGFSCFKTFFEESNSESKSLVFIQPAMLLDRMAEYASFKGHAVLLVKATVPGLDTLWTIILSADDERVSEEAALYLVNLLLFTRLPIVYSDDLESLSKSAKGLWSNFVSNCMQRLESSFQSFEGTLSSRSAGRIIRLLLNFLSSVRQLRDHFDAPFYKPFDRNPFYILVEEGIPIFSTFIFEVPVFVQEVIMRTLPVSSNGTSDNNYKNPTTLYVRIRQGCETIGDLRDRLAEYIKCDPKLLAVYIHNGSPKTFSARTESNVLYAPLENLHCEQLRQSSKKEEIVITEIAAHIPNDRNARIRRSLEQYAELLTKSHGHILPDITFSQSFFKDTTEAYLSGFDAPQKLLSDGPQHFDALFRLLRFSLSVSPSLVRDIWKLIEFIPRARVKVDMIHSMNGHFVESDEIRYFENEVSSLNSSSSSSNLFSLATKISAPIQWEIVLGGESPLEFLYSLQILNAKLEAEGKSASIPMGSPRDATALALKSEGDVDAVKSPLLQFSGSSDVQSLWGRAFARLGGVEYLYSKVMQMNLQELFVFSNSDNGASILMQCASLLLRIFARFILSPSFCLRSFYSWKDAKPCVFRVDRSALSLRLLEWIAFASTISLPRAESSNDGAHDSIIPSINSALHASTQVPFSAKNNSSSPRQNTLSVESDVLQASIEILAICLSGAEELPGTSRAEDLVKGHFESLCPQPDVFSAVYNSLNNNDVLAAALCSSALDVQAREIVSKSLENAWNICALAEKNVPLPLSVPSLDKFILASFLRNIRLLYAFPNTCRQFVDAIAKKLLPVTHEHPSNSMTVKTLPIDEVALLNDLSQLIRSHPVVEIGSDARDIQDDVLFGLLVITRNVIIGNASLRSLAGAPLEEGGFGLLQEVFSKCLFSFLEIPSSSSDKIIETESSLSHPFSVLGGQLPKCKQTATRAAALELLSEIAKGDARNCLYLAREFLPHHDALAANELTIAESSLMAGNSADFSDIDSKLLTVTTTLARLSAPRQISPDETASTNSSRSQRAALQPRSSTGFVGLRNLGCICYMNSTLQQFYMTPAFRSAVLSHCETSTSEAERADSIMFQLQRQFAYLQESEKSFFTPTALCSAIKDWEGRPTDYFEQKDVPEFLTKLFIDMESQLQGTRLATIAKDVYGLTTIQELIAEDPRGRDRPRLYSSKEESTYFVNLTVKGFKSLADSLAKYTEGEQVDYSWELTEEDGGGSGGGGEKGKETKVSIKSTKSYSIKSTGDCLMFHLSRFEFDLNLMEQVKVNDRFDFPAQLDLYPYTIYGRSAPAKSPSPSSDSNNIDASSFMYELVGVVIHMGTPAGGHYISYARERGPTGLLPSDSWFEFNDSVVTPWAGLDRLEQDCFGGFERTTVKNGPQPWQTFEKPKTANAFCLFYDRVHPGKRSSLASQVGQTKTVFSLPRVEISSGRPPRVLFPKDLLGSFSHQLRVAHGSGREHIRAQLRAPVPPSILATIKRENLSFWRQVYTQQPAYTTCMKSLIHSFIQATPPRQKAATYPWRPITTLSDAIERGGEGLIIARLMWSFGLNTIQESVSPDPTIPDDWIENVGLLFSSNLVASAWLLQDVLADGGDTLRKVLLLGSDQGPALRTRIFVAKVLCAVIKAVWPVELSGPQTEREKFEVAEARSFRQSTGRLVLDLIDVLIQQMQDAHKHYRNFNSMFEILHCFSRASDASRQYLIEARMIGRICDLLITGHSPDPTVNAEPWPPFSSNYNGGKMINTTSSSSFESQSTRHEDTRPNFDNVTCNEAVHYLHMVIWLLHDLVRGCLPLGASARRPCVTQMSPFQIQPAQPLNDVDRRLLTSFVLAEGLLNTRQFLYTNPKTLPGRSANETFLLDAIAPIYAHLIWDIDPPEILPPSMNASPIAPLSPRNKVIKRAETEVEGYASWHGGDAPEVLSNSDEHSHPSISAISVISAGEGNLIGILTAVARQMLREDFEHFIRAPFVVARIIGLNACIPTKHHPLAAPYDGQWPLPCRNALSAVMKSNPFMDHSYKCVSFVLHHLAAEMKVQSRYYAETIRSTEHMIYLARVDVLARSWFQSKAGVENFGWLENWFQQNTLTSSQVLKFRPVVGSPILQGKVKDANFTLRFYHSLDPDLHENLKRLLSGNRLLLRFIDIEEESSEDVKLSKFEGRIVEAVSSHGVLKGKIEAVEVRTNAHNSAVDLQFRIKMMDSVAECIVPGGQRASNYASSIPSIQYRIDDEDDKVDREGEPDDDETDNGDDEDIDDQIHDGDENEHYDGESKHQSGRNYNNANVNQSIDNSLTIRRPDVQNNHQKPYQQESNNLIFRGMGANQNHPEVSNQVLSSKANDTRRVVSDVAINNAYQRVSSRDINESDVDGYSSDKAAIDDDDDDDDYDDDDNDDDHDEIDDDEELRRALKLSSDEAIAKSSLALIPPVFPSAPPSAPPGTK